jgi:hypothetical protein
VRGLTQAEALQIQSDAKRAYQLAFNAPGGEAVLMDLGVFCRARESCLIPGQRDMTSALEGRREVYLRIRDYLDLTPEQLVEKYHPPAKGAYGDDQ